MKTPKELIEEVEKGCGKSFEHPINHNWGYVICGKSNYNGSELLCDKCKSKIKGIKLGAKETIQTIKDVIINCQNKECEELKYLLLKDLEELEKEISK